MNYCTPTELYNFLKLKIQYNYIENDLNTAITVATAWILSQIGKIDENNVDNELKTLLKEATLFYAGARILKQYWEELQIDDYEQRKIEQYEQTAKETVQAILYRLKNIQDVITDEDINLGGRVMVPSFTFTITNR